MKNHINRFAYHKLTMGIGSRSAIAIAIAISVVAQFGFHAATNGNTSAQATDITEKSCEFFVDVDGDLKGDIQIQIGNDHMIIQDSLIVGSCKFKLLARETSTLQIESDLVGWEGSVEIFNTYDRSTEVYTIDRELAVLPHLHGDLEIEVGIIRGHAPRSIKTKVIAGRYRSLDYEHDVQVPRRFRIVGVAVTSNDIVIERLESNVQSATEAYMNARQYLVDIDSDTPTWIDVLAFNWLEEGYPRIAIDIAKASLEQGETGDGNSAFWIWPSIIILILILSIATVVVLAIHFLPRLRSRDDEVEVRKPTNLRM